MRSATWLRLLALTAILANACGSAQHAQSQQSTPSQTTYPSPTTASNARLQCPADQTAPIFPPAVPSSRNLALVTLRDSNVFVVRDITDINHPFTVSNLGSLTPISGPNVAYSPTFVNATDISYYNDTGEVLRKPFDGAATAVANSCNGIYGLAWSPDGQTAAYVTSTMAYSAGELHLVSGGVNRIAASTPPFGGAGCESPVDCERFDARLLFSPNGQHISFVNSWPGPPFTVWTSDGHKLASKDSGLSTWSVWSGSTLYFRTDQGVTTWRDGKEQVLLPGIAWVDSKASPAGGEIVYYVRDGSGTAHVDMLDTSTGLTRELASNRAYPAFLTARYVWYMGERSCASGDPYPCGFGGPTISNGKTYIYDLQTASEAESIITKVLDIWPHPA